MALTYTSLKSEVADWSHRSDLTAKMDIFTELAEAVINKDLRALDMEKELIDVSFTDSYYDLPADYLEMRSLYLTISGARRAIELLPPKVLDQRYNFATGSPCAYTVKAGQIEFRPGIEASSPYVGSYTYFARVPSLVTNATNTILTKFPMVYLSAMMTQVYLYLQDDEEMAKWVSIYDNQVSMANKSAGGGRYNLPSVRSA